MAVRQVVLLGRRGVLQAAFTSNTPCNAPCNAPCYAPWNAIRNAPRYALYVSLCICMCCQAAFTIKELRDLTKLEGVRRSVEATPPYHATPPDHATPPYKVRCSVEAPHDAFNAAVLAARHHAACSLQPAACSLLPAICSSHAAALNAPGLRPPKPQAATPTTGCSTAPRYNVPGAVQPRVITVPGACSSQDRAAPSEARGPHEVRARALP